MPDDNHRRHRDRHKRKSSPTNVRSVVIKTEAPSPEQYRPSRKNNSPRVSPHSFDGKIKEDPDRSRSPEHKRNCFQHSHISNERSRRRPRIHSPVIIRDSENTFRRPIHNDHQSEKVRGRPEFGKSGLLSNSHTSNVTKETVNFGLSGKLAEDTNTFKGVVIKYNEPEDARKPTEHWRLYAFKGNKTLPILHIHRQSGFLIGRDRKIADIPMDHPSISKQHAVLQYRFVQGATRLYLIDLESVNGTYLNNNRIEPRRYYELLEKDVIKFGFSTREYVVMTAQTASDDEADNSP